MSFPWLTASMLLPVVGAVVVAMLPRREGAGADLPKKVALGFSLLTLVLVAVIGLGFDVGGDRYQFVEQHQWIQSFGAHYALGVDGLGLLMVNVMQPGLHLPPGLVPANWSRIASGVSAATSTRAPQAGTVSRVSRPPVHWTQAALPTCVRRSPSFST